MTQSHNSNDKPVPGHGGFKPGEGPSAERLRPEEFSGGGGGATMESLAPETSTRNQDGTRLGSWPGSDQNPGVSVGEKLHDGDFEVPTQDEIPIGSTEAVLPTQGRRVEHHPGVAGGRSYGDFRAPGAVEADPGNVGLNEGQDD